MPLPLLPFAIKGAFVLGKILLAKGTVAKVAVVTTKAAVSTFGAAATTGAVITACVVVGGVTWGADQINRGRKAYDAAKRGDLGEAAGHLSAIATSVHTVHSDFGGDLVDWINAGKPLSRVPQLANQAKALADEAMART